MSWAYRSAGSPVGPERTIVVASRNRGKTREIAAVLGELGVEVVGLDEVDPGRSIAEPAETGRTFAENARHKAAYYARATGLQALADDSGLEVEALAGRPGVRSARYGADEAGPDAARSDIDRANNAKLLRELEDVPQRRRGARFVCHLALSDGRETLLEASGAFEGRIALTPAGENGFGYDPLFYLPDLDKTVAQLPAKTKNEISHRGQATREFARKLKETLDR